MKIITCRWDIDLNITDEWYGWQSVFIQALLLFLFFSVWPPGLEKQFGHCYTSVYDFKLTKEAIEYAFVGTSI